MVSYWQAAKVAAWAATKHYWYVTVKVNWRTLPPYSIRSPIAYSCRHVVINRANLNAVDLHR